MIKSKNEIPLIIAGTRIVGKDSISVEKRIGIWNTREKNSRRQIDTTIQRLDQIIVISRFIEKK